MLTKKTVRIVNLDPAAEEPFPYGTPDVDIRDLISSDDAMEEMNLGPNGGLMFAMEYLGQNFDWLQSQLDDFADDEYFLFDCPGQIELYVHHPVMRQLVENLQVQQGIRLCGVFLIDATFVRDAAKFVSASLMTLNTMVHLELPHLNVLSKADLLEDTVVQNEDESESDSSSDSSVDQDDLTLFEKAPRRNEFWAPPMHLRKKRRGRGKKPLSLKDLDRFLDNDVESLLPELHGSMHPRYRELNGALIGLLEEYKMVSYAALNPKDDESLETIAYRINDLIQFYESQEVDDKAMERAEQAEDRRAEKEADTGDADAGFSEYMEGLGRGMENLDIGDMNLEP